MNEQEKVDIELPGHLKKVCGKILHFLGSTLAETSTYRAAMAS